MNRYKVIVVGLGKRGLHHRLLFTPTIASRSPAFAAGTKGASKPPRPKWGIHP